MKERGFSINHKTHFEPVQPDNTSGGYLSLHNYTLLLKHQGILTANQTVHTPQDLILALNGQYSLPGEQPHNERELFTAIQEAVPDSEGKACVSGYSPGYGTHIICVECSGWSCTMSYRFVPDEDVC